MDRVGNKKGKMRECESICEREREIGETDLKKCEQINVKVSECEDSFMKKKVRVIPCALVCVLVCMQIYDCSSVSV